MLVDSHCHLDRIKFAYGSGGIAAMLDVAAANSVTRMLSVATDLEHWASLASMTEPYPQVALSVGVHPNEDSVRAPTVASLVALGREQRVVAIGETGLDYYYGSGSSMQRQEIWFRIHIAAARELGKPLIVHTRNARTDTLRILRDEGAAEIGGVIHCFTEDWEMATQLLALGFYISFSGIVTFKNVKQIHDVVRQMPAERILVETDSPYLTPIPHRGKPNNPAWVRYIADYIANLRGESLDQVANFTNANYSRLFSLPLEEIM